MSIILKGIDLPNNGQIELIIRSHGKVFSKTRGIYAEAIQIPKGHGRLIEEHYHGELKAKHAEGIFIMYRPADEDTNRFILEEEKIQ
jgi:hypothetical protein